MERNQKSGDAGGEEDSLGLYWRGELDVRLTRAPPTRRLDERAAAEEEKEEPVGELTALCCEGGSVL